MRAQTRPLSLISCPVLPLVFWEAAVAIQNYPGNILHVQPNRMEHNAAAECVQPNWAAWQQSCGRTPVADERCALSSSRSKRPSRQPAWTLGSLAGSSSMHPRHRSRFASFFRRWRNCWEMAGFKPIKSVYISTKDGSSGPLSGPPKLRSLWTMHMDTVMFQLA